MIYIDYEAPGGITDVGFVYTPLGDDTPFQLELPAHNAGDAVFVWARGASGAPGIMKIRSPSFVDLMTLTSIHAESPSIVNGWHLMWGILPVDAYELYGSAGTNQFGIHVYRGVTGIGDVVTSTEVPDNFGADIPALTLDETDGTSRVWCGVIFNQPKEGASEPSTPAGLTKRLTSPSAIGGGTGVSYDTTDGVTAFFGARVDAFGAAYYVAWAVEMKQ